MLYCQENVSTCTPLRYIEYADICYLTCPTIKINCSGASGLWMRVCEQLLSREKLKSGHFALIRSFEGLPCVLSFT